LRSEILVFAGDTTASAIAQRNHLRRCIIHVARTSRA